MKLFISGKITGDPNYREKFEDAERLLIARGYEAVNPAKENMEGMTYRECINRTLHMLSECHGILLLSDWLISPGARLECMYAQTVGMPIYEEDVIRRVMKMED